MVSKNLDGEDLGYVYISEANIDDNQITNIDAKVVDGITYVQYDQCLQSFDVMNRNHRMYDGDNVMECINGSEKIQSSLAHNSWYMEFDHPLSRYKDVPLSPERIQTPYYPDRCAIITNPRRKGNLLWATIKTTGNEHGISLARDMIAIGLKPMASLRAIANMTMRHGKPYVQCKRVITYDRVDYASHREADMVGEPTTIIKKTKAITESTIDTVKESVSSIVVPLKDILLDLGNTDRNTSVVLESFGLTEENVIGLDTTSTTGMKTVIKNNDDRLYINIDPDSVRKVQDYLSSF